MDKQKIVFIVDDGLPSGGLFDALKEFGDKHHIDVEMVKLQNTLQGTKPDMAIWDEGPIPVPEHILNMDFTALEQRCMALADALTADGEIISYKTGRRPSEPEYQPIPGLHGLPYRRFGKSMLQQDLYAMLVEQIREADRNMAKILVEPGMRGSSKIPMFARYGREVTKPADHPSRKREPKGPRGQWGKLK